MNPTGEHSRKQRWRTGLGLAAVAFYAAYGAEALARGEPADLLWACHLAALLIGTGLILGSPALNAIGVLWLVTGIPLWGYYLATGGKCLLTSVLTHLGGLAAGLAGSRILGFPRRAWWKAVAALAALNVLCRWVTPPASNVNLAHAIWPGWEPYFPSHLAYLLAILAMNAGVFLAAEIAMRALFSRSSGEEGIR